MTRHTNLQDTQAEETANTKLIFPFQLQVADDPDCEDDQTQISHGRPCYEESSDGQRSVQSFEVDSRDHVHTSTELRITRRNMWIPAVTLISPIPELLNGLALGKNENDDNNVDKRQTNHNKIQEGFVPKRTCNTNDSLKQKECNGYFANCKIQNSKGIRDPAIFQGVCRLFRSKGPDVLA